MRHVYYFGNATSNACITVGMQLFKHVFFWSSDELPRFGQAMGSICIILERRWAAVASFGRATCHAHVVLVRQWAAFILFWSGNMRRMSCIDQAMNRFCFV